MEVHRGKQFLEKSPQFVFYKQNPKRQKLCSKSTREGRVCGPTAWSLAWRRVSSAGVRGVLTPAAAGVALLLFREGNLSLGKW